MRDFYISFYRTDIKLKVSQATYYKIVKNEIGEFSPNSKRTYIMSLGSLRGYPRLYNRARKKAAKND